MRSIPLLALLLAACATTRPADFSKYDDPDSPDRPDCIAAPDACFREAQRLIQHDDTLSDGVHRLFTACKYKSLAACELLGQHAKFPAPSNPSQPTHCTPGQTFQ